MLLRKTDYARSEAIVTLVSLAGMESSRNPNYQLTRRNDGVSYLAAVRREMIVHWRLVKSSRDETVTLTPGLHSVPWTSSSCCTSFWSTPCCACLGEGGRPAQMGKSTRLKTATSPIHDGIIVRDARSDQQTMTAPLAVAYSA